MKKYYVNGKNYKRAYRRHKRYVKFKQRSYNWILSVSQYHLSDGAWSTHLDLCFKDIQLGNDWQFLRTTGNPCNCYGCSGQFKYKRKQKQYWK